MKNYPKLYSEMIDLMKSAGQEIPNQMKAFSALHKTATAEGAVSKANKELIALGIAIAVRCDGCIAFHVNDALKAGCNREEIMETIGVAILMGGGPAVMYGCEALAALNQFTSEPEDVTEDEKELLESLRPEES